MRSMGSRLTGVAGTARTLATAEQARTKEEKATMMIDRTVVVLVGEGCGGFV